MFSWRQRRKMRKRAGQPYFGPAAYTTDYSQAPRPGYYALADDGKTLLSDVPLTMLDLAPGDPEDGACMLVFSGPDDPPQRGANGDEIRQGPIVGMEASAYGRGRVSG